MRIALAGNPNSGKTTLYNVLTGKAEKVGNWAGVTVDKRESSLKSDFSSDDITIVDLPGAYSMSPFTNDESITSDFVTSQNVDVIINIVDATNISRSLFFSTQLLELGVPVVLALNKTDLNEKKNNTIDCKMLADKLKCPVVQTVSINANNDGIKEVVEIAISLFETEQKVPYSNENVDLTSKESVEKADKERFEFVNEIVEKVETRATKTNEENSQDKLDEILAHKWFGIPIFAAVMFGVFYISQSFLGPVIADFLVGLIEGLGETVGESLEGSSEFLSSLLVDGIIGGVGAVVGFLPLVMVMYFLLALLEDCGYMARVAVVMDRFFKKVGLSGKSIIPMIIGTGCAIPGIMACRTIKNEHERCTTAILTPFIPCGAKLPVIALFAGAFFEDAAWVGTLMYFLGIILIIFGAWLTKQITGYDNKKSYFIIELPEYKAPSIKLAIGSMFERAKAFIIKAGTIILLCNAVVHVMQTFDWSLQVVEEGMEHTSILAGIASPFALILIPLGFGTWQLAAAAVTGFIAKENVVGTLAVVFAITNFIDVEELEIISNAGDVGAVMGMTSVAALAYLIFNLFTPPCFAAIGSMNSEVANRKWLWSGIGLQFATAYVSAFLVYQVGTLITAGTIGVGFVPGLIVCVLIIGYISMLVGKTKKRLSTTEANFEMEEVTV